MTCLHTGFTMYEQCKAVETTSKSENKKKEKKRKKTARDIEHNPVFHYLQSTAVCGKNAFVFFMFLHLADLLTPLIFLHLIHSLD